MNTENRHRSEAADQPTPVALVVLAWLIVVIPLAYGLWQTLIKAGQLLRGLNGLPGRRFIVVPVRVAGRPLAGASSGAAYSAYVNG